MTGNPAVRSMRATLREIRYVELSKDASPGGLRFADPSPREAVVVTHVLEGPPSKTEALAFDALDLVTVAIAPKDEPSLRVPWTNWFSASASDAPAITVRLHGIEVVWRPGGALLFAAAEQMEPLVAALVEFAYYEGELRKLEREIADAWSELDADKRLAYEVTPSDLEDRERIGRRVDQTLQRRMRHARMEPHLYWPGVHLPVLARKLGEELREADHIEDRLEIVDGQLEVFEHIYEMCSQRIGEFRDAHRSHTLEWTIIVLLAVETIIMLADLLWNLQSK